MKIIRSTKCSLKYLTKSKQDILQQILKEYKKVVNIFINYFWENSDIPKYALLKPIIDIPKKDTWFSTRLRVVAAREALDMIKSVKKVFDSNKEMLYSSILDIENKISTMSTETRKNRRRINNLYKLRKKKFMRYSMIKPTKPKHKGNRMCFSSATIDFRDSKNSKLFDAWLHFHSLGNKIIFDIPIKFHEHYNKLDNVGKRLNSYIITKDYVQFCFKIQTGEKKIVRKLAGIDSGINALASTSTKEQFGKDIKELINKIKRCKYGSKRKKRISRALKQRISEVAKEIVQKFDLIVVERLKNMNKNTKLKGRLSKNIRSSIGNWNYRYWLERLEQQCEWNRVSFRTVLPYYTSQRCPVCGHTDRKNRSGEIFRCQACDYTGNADIVAARNILERFLTGTYGSCYKHLDNKFL